MSSIIGAAGERDITFFRHIVKAQLYAPLRQVAEHDLITFCEIYRDFRFDLSTIESRPRAGVLIDQSEDIVIIQLDDAVNPAY
jgi:hypothetical protein